MMETKLLSEGIFQRSAGLLATEAGITIDKELRTSLNALHQRKLPVVGNVKAG